jgi:heat shock protein HslJ
MAEARGPAAAALGFSILMMAAAGQAANDPAMPEFASTAWRAETIMGRPVMDYAASTITFEADGRVQGRGGCNRYFGSSTIEGERLSLGPLGATKMTCAPALMDQETRFFEALQTAERWTFDEHGLLLVYSSGADQPSRFAPFEE